MIIRIDTSSDSAFLEFEEKEKKEKFEFPNRRGLDNKLLLEIEKRLKPLEKTRGKIEKIEVNSGPGRYTGLRTGIVIANILIEVFGLSQKLIFPQYPEG